MSTKRTIGFEVEAWIRREKGRADACNSQITDLERRRDESLRKVRVLQELLDASDYLNAPPEDDDDPF